MYQVLLLLRSVLVHESSFSKWHKYNCACISLISSRTSRSGANMTVRVNILRVLIYVQSFAVSIDA